MPDIITKQEQDAIDKWLRKHKPQHIPEGESAFKLTLVWRKTPGGFRLVYDELVGKTRAEVAAILRGGNRSAHRGGISPALTKGRLAYQERMRVASERRRDHVRELRRSGMAAAAIADKLGISQATVYKDMKR